MKRLRVIYMVLMAGIAMTAAAQDNNQAARRYVKVGNKLYRKSDYASAETAYRKAFEQNKANPQALYNLGEALLTQQKDTAAIKFFEAAAKTESNPLRKSKSFHNMGIIAQGRQMYAEAIEQYKQALRLNPNDDETRYNLVLCQKLLKNQPQNQDGGGSDQNDENGEDKKEQDQQQQQQNKEQQESQQDKPQMSKENAEQLLQAAMQQERQTQKRMKEAQQQPQRRQVEKNW